MAKTPKFTANPELAAALAVVGHEVASPLDHDGVRYEVGSHIDLDDAIAAPLLARGVLRAQAETAAPQAE